MSDSVTPEELEGLLGGSAPPRVLDVRRAADREQDPSMLPGAAWKDPEQVAAWAPDLGSGAVVIYCVRGGSVSRSVQASLRERNIDVQFIEGGLDAWKRSGRPVQVPGSR